VFENHHAPRMRSYSPAHTLVLYPPQAHEHWCRSRPPSSVRVHRRTRFRPVPVLPRHSLNAHLAGEGIVHGQI
jgi:hypothetical protein